MGLAHHEALLKRLHGRGVRRLLRGHVHGLVLDRKARQVGHILRLRRREESRLSVLLGQQLDDGAHVLLKADLKDPISLVDGEHLQVAYHEALGRREVVEQPTGRRHHVAHPLDQLIHLGAPVGAADDEPVRLPMVGEQLGEHAKNLQRELARGRNGDVAGPVSREPLRAREQLHRWNEEGKRLARARLCLR